MFGRSLRSLVLLAAVPLALSTLSGPPAAADPTPPPRPSARDLPEGPWPPSRVLAGPSDSIVTPEAAISTASCPTAPYGAQSRAPGTGKTVALTFDDGPGPSTFAMLNVLERYGVPATFFNIGVNEAYRPAEVRAEMTMSWALGNHTWDHPEMPTLSYSAQASEMDRATAEQTALTGQPSCIFRPPYGEYNTNTLDAAYNRKMAVWNWSVDTEDWQAPDASSYWVNRIISLAKAGSSQTHPVILMHNAPDGNPATVAALPTIIEYYRGLGYTFVDLLGHAGYTLPAPAATVDNSGRHVFYRGSNGAVYERTQVNGVWQAPVSLGGTTVDGPAAVAVGGSTIVFHQGTNNQLYQKTVTGGAATGWTSLGGILTSRPAVAVSANGTVSVIVRTTNRAASIKERVNGTWGTWHSLGGLLTSAPAAAVTSGTELTVVVATTGGVLSRRHHTAAGWSSWSSLGGPTSADPGLIATAGGTGLVLVVRDSNGVGSFRRGNAAATSWSTWSAMGATLYSGFGGGFAEPANQYAVAFRSDRRLWVAVSDSGTTPTGWTWQLVG